ncbi:MAG: OmpA family protein [Propionibacteriaceae bacterium]|nr:OmpA family protein [Propionibacteriaceae bacterium]
MRCRRAALVATITAAVVIVGAPEARAVSPHDPEVDATKAVVFPVERLDAEVQELIFPEANIDGSVVESGNEITLAADVFFAYNDASLNARAVEEIEALVGRLRPEEPRAITVTGHTDNTGTDAHNQGLSERRAQSVATALGSALPGVSISAAGKGASEPVADNGTEEGRAQNRRVVITTSTGG